MRKRGFLYTLVFFMLFSVGVRAEESDYTLVGDKRINKNEIKNAKYNIERNFPIFTEATQFNLWGNKEVLLKDRYNNEHKLLSKKINFNDNGTANLEFMYSFKALNNNCEVNSDCTNVIFAEIYTEKDGKVTYADEFFWDVSYRDYAKLNIKNFDTNTLASLDYIYVNFALGNSIFPNKYDSYKPTKIKVTPTDWMEHWAYREIESGMSNGWVNNSDIFRPNDSITRAEFIKIVNKAFVFTKKMYDVPFKDVSSSDWWYSEVQIALGNGYISTGNENFRPRDPITRQEVANIITTITKTKDNNLDKLSKYSDGHLVFESMKSSVEGSIEQGFMGVGNNMFNPIKNITRAEAIVTLNRVIKI